MPFYAELVDAVVTRVFRERPATVPNAPPGDNLGDIIETDTHVSPGWTYDAEAGRFAAPVVEITVVPDDIKREAFRRIVAICPEWKQRNLTAQASILAEKGRANWTAEEQTAWDAGFAIWAQIDAIRSRSDEIEAMDPIPEDYTDDSRWPA